MLELRARQLVGLEDGDDAIDAGGALELQARDVLAIKDPAKALLPRANVSTTYIFTKRDFYFVYPNNYNHFVHFFRNTFQHGGISLEEMLVPVIRA